MRSKRTFRLKTLLYIQAIAAVVTCGGAWGYRWVTTRHMRQLDRAIANSMLDPQSKQVLQKLAWSAKAWETGLIDDLTRAPTIRRIAWQYALPDDGPNQRVLYLLDAFDRPAAKAPIPLVCAVLDQDMNLCWWQSVALFSYGFLDARLDDNLLTISTSANWFVGKGTYRYALQRTSLQPLDDGFFSKFDVDEALPPQPQLLPRLVL